jgi:hypothetical protein
MAAGLSARAVRAVNCSSCGAAIELRGLAWTRTVACAQCGAVLDAKDPNLRVLQRAEERMTVKPLIPLGTRGEWRGAPYDVIGLQQRTIYVDGDEYSWREYLLFNPYRGFRYLTEYDGHWNDVVPLPGIPVVEGAGARSSVRQDGTSFRLFQTAHARTTFIAGEFPWEVRAGDSADVRDYVAPPHVLSAESTDNETTWSRGTYVEPQAVWRAFGLQGTPRPPVGIYANQPSPYAGGVGSWWRAFGALALVCLLALVGREITARRSRVYEGRFQLAPAPAFARAVNADTTVVGTPLVTPRFTVPGASGNVVVETEADVSDEWLYLQYTLVDETTGRAWPFGREVAYYSGVDGDGSWSEGRRRDRVTLGPVPGGRYVLRVEPAGQPRPGHPISYTLRVTRDVPAAWPYLVALLALLVPPIVGTYRAASFETRRWAESDAGSKLSSMIQEATDE